MGKLDHVDQQEGQLILAVHVLKQLKNAMSVWNISESLHGIILPPKIILFTTELWSSLHDMPLIDVFTLSTLPRMRRFVVATENAAVRRLGNDMKPHGWSPSQTAHHAVEVRPFAWSTCRNVMRRIRFWGGAGEGVFRFPDIGSKELSDVPPLVQFLKIYHT